MLQLVGMADLTSMAAELPCPPLLLGCGEGTPLHVWPSAGQAFLEQTDGGEPLPCGFPPEVDGLFRLLPLPIDDLAPLTSLTAEALVPRLCFALLLPEDEPLLAVLLSMPLTAEHCRPMLLSAK